MPLDREIEATHPVQTIPPRMRAPKLVLRLDSEIATIFFNRYRLARRPACKSGG